MPFDYDDPYVVVSCTICRATRDAVQIEDGAGELHWIPRSCLHGASDLIVKKAMMGDEAELKIREWIAKQEGLV